MAKPVTAWMRATGGLWLLDGTTPLDGSAQFSGKPEKPVTVWVKVTEPKTAWSVNSAYSPNPYPYDSASHTYDSAVDTYDGVVAGQSPITTAPVTQWTAV